MHSPSTPTTISVRFLFLIPLMLHTPVAWMRPLVERTGLDSEAKVNSAPIPLSDDIVFARPVVCCVRSAWVAAPVAPATSEMQMKKNKWVVLAVACSVAPSVA